MTTVQALKFFTPYKIEGYVPNRSTIMPWMAGSLPHIPLKAYVALAALKIASGGESLMPDGVNSFGSVIPRAFFISLVITANFDGPARAESPCIEHPPQPAAEVTHPSVHHDYPTCSVCHATATEVLLWSFRYDHTGRKCWFLGDTYGRDVTEQHMRGAGAATQTIWSRLSSVFDNFSVTRVPINATSDGLPGSSADPARKRQTNTANANGTDDNVRISQKNGGEGGTTKQVSKVSPQPGEQALYDEFLRWREAQELIKTPDQRKELGLYEEFLRWSTPDPSRSMQPLMGKAQL
jgi:hypothetical protein